MLPKLDPQPKFPQKLWGLFTGFFYFTPLLIGMFLVNLTQFFALLIKPFSPHIFRRINWACAYSWWGTSVFMMEKLKGIKIVFTGDEVPPEENAIVIANHQEMTDPNALFCLALRKKRLAHLKWFAKDIIKYVPGAGWGLYIAGNFFVKRDWLRDQKKIDKVFERVLKEKEPMWIISFLEGTRITPEKLKRSQAFCKERGRPVFEHVLAPRTKGFEATVQALRTHLDAVYDVTIAFPEGTPKISHLFLGYIHQIHMHVRRFPIQSLPTNEKDIGEWVWKVFEEKERLLQYFLEHKRFP